MSLYWIFRLGFRSSLAMLWASCANCWMNISYLQLVSKGAPCSGRLRGETHGCYCYDECRVVGACVDVLIHAYDLLDSCYYITVSP
jgi:hypothetical protein